MSPKFVAPVCAARRERRAIPLLLAALCTFVLAAPARSHHSFAATYDAKQPVTVEGVITKMAWMNPHAFLYVDVQDKSGKTTNWAFELSPVAMLIRYNLKPNMVVQGARITVRGFRAKDGTKMLASGHEIVLADGRTFIVGPGAVTREEPGQ
jgi:hypothetical protein